MRHVDCGVSKIDSRFCRFLLDGIHGEVYFDTIAPLVNDDYGRVEPSEVVAKKPPKSIRDDLLDLQTKLLQHTKEYNENACAEVDGIAREAVNDLLEIIHKYDELED